MRLSKDLPPRVQRTSAGRLFVIELSGNRIFSIDLDGDDRIVILPNNGTHPPTQLQISVGTGKLQLCDCESMRGMRGNVDGAHGGTLVEGGSGDLAYASRWCVGIAAAES